MNKYENEKKVANHNENKLTPKYHTDSLSHPTQAGTQPPPPVR